MISEDFTDDTLTCPPGKAFIGYTVFAIIFLTSVVLLNVLMGMFPFPTYGVWTGNVPLENKLKKLREFAKAGPVDAIVMGSSIADNGFSTETFSAALSEASGRPVRVFNMATGAGDWQMFPVLYRLARLYANPRQLYLLHPGSNGTGDNHVQANTLWPDGQFMYSNAGKLLRYPLLFRLSEAVWMSPLVNASGAARDMILWGRYVHMPSSSLLNYSVNEHGDKVSYLFMHDETQFNVYRGFRENMIVTTAADYANQAVTRNCESNNPYFSRDDLQGIRELKTLMDSDKAELTLVSQEPSAGFGITASDYKNALNVFFDSAVQECLSPRKVLSSIDFLPLKYEIEDTQHMNVYGARRFAQAVAAKLTGTPSPSARTVGFYAPMAYSSGPDFHHLMGVIVSDGTSHKAIDVRYYTLNVSPVDLATLRSPGVLQLELLDRDGSVHIAKASKSNGKTISFSMLEALPAEPTAFLARLVEVYSDGRKHYLVVPIEQYAWTN